MEQTDTRSSPTSIRLSDNVLEKVKEDAKNEKRSVSKQIEYIIESYYKIVRMTQK